MSDVEEDVELIVTDLFAQEIRASEVSDLYVGERRIIAGVQKAYATRHGVGKVDPRQLERYAREVLAKMTQTGLVNGVWTKIGEEKEFAYKFNPGAH